jgi:hypothetical protein
MRRSTDCTASCLGGEGLRRARLGPGCPERLSISSVNLEDFAARRAQYAFDGGSSGDRITGDRLRHAVRPRTIDFDGEVNGLRFRSA